MAEAHEPTSLNGRTAIVTGGSRGIGLRMARALRAEGANVVILARASAALDDTAREMPDTLAVACDLQAPADVRAGFAAAMQRFGRVDILINNAALCLINRIEEASDEDIEREIKTNLMGPVLTIREAAPLMRAVGGGDIVNVSSESVRIPLPYLTLYAATKAGLEQLTIGVRNELRPDKTRVTILRSGSVAESNIGAQWSPEKAQKFMDAMTTSGSYAAVGAPIRPETTARALINVLTLPRESNIDIIEVKSI
jgi:NAD(P)-dependent dehydrogenase (short-subunit alcohol dehydrogenase family)